jgi:hypothetical protein
VKTTLEIPDPLFRKAKATAAQRGQSLKDLVTEALQEKLSPRAARVGAVAPPWMEGFGKLRHLRQAHVIDAAVEEAFEVIDPEDPA